MTMKYPEEFTGLLPYAGFWMEGVCDDYCSNVPPNYPVYVVHGYRDRVVPIEEGEIIVDKFNACGANAHLERVAATHQPPRDYVEIWHTGFMWIRDNVYDVTQVPTASWEDLKKQYK
jgi:predicted esterase